ncbi:MAG: hypothetical protein U1E48_11740 [Paracoccaceae bacterium]
MVSRILVLAPLVLLAACGTPQERCIRSGTDELRKVDRMIAETQNNLARGYSYQDETIVTHSWEPCFDGFGGFGARPGMRGMCLEPDETTIRRSVPIDPAAETRKLEYLKARRKELLPAANQTVASCKASYPEN